MKKQARPKVWLVDDREENRRRFIEFHAAEFDVKVFESPDQLLTAIRHDRPDALLCDIFFYRDPEEREKKEAPLAQKAQQIQRLAVELRSDRAADGIGLIERVRHQFRDDPPFPIYAYTSKGPYLLQDEGFDRLEKLDARWLFKGKYSPHVRYRKLFSGRCGVYFNASRFSPELLLDATPADRMEAGPGIPPIGVARRRKWRCRRSRCPLPASNSSRWLRTAPRPRRRRCTDGH